MSAGIWHSVFVSVTGVVYAFGYNGDGQILDGNRSEDQPLPFEKPAVQVSCGNRHTCVVFNDGSSKTFGWNAKGQCEGENITKAFGWTSLKRI